jgi:probable HAF family extracellular repeat protein
MKSLGTLPGDLRSEALGINGKGQIVGLSRGGPFVIRAVLWDNGRLFDMNQLTVSGSPFLLFGNDIDQQGRVVGEAVDLNTGDQPGYIATPLPPGAVVSSSTPATPQGSLPENIQRQLERRLGLAGWALGVN